MKMIKDLLPIVLLALLAGCASDPATSVIGKAPDKAGRVQIAMYDATPRQPSQTMDIYDAGKPVERPHKSLAKLTCEGDASEEGIMLNAIAWQTRRLGAQALEVLEPEYPNGRGPTLPFAPSTTRRVFRANALIYQ
jgi:hypothetical protein